MLTFVEFNIGFDDYNSGVSLADFTTFRYNGDVAGVTAVLVIGGGVFGALACCIVWLEQLQTPTILDHLRHCALLYAVLWFLGIVLIVNYRANYGPDASGVADGYAVAAASFFVAGYATLLNALLFVCIRRYCDRRGAG